MPQVEVRLRPEAAAPVRPDARRRPPRGDDAGQGDEGRRGLRGAEDLRRRRLGRRSRSRSDVAALRGLPIETPLGAHVPLGDVADVAIVPAPNEIKREGGVAADRRDLQRRRAATWAASPARSRRRSGSSTFAARVPPRVPRRIRRARRSRSAGCWPWRRCRSLGILLVLHVDFRSVAADGRWSFLTLPFALIGGVVGGVPGRRRAVARLAGRLRDRARHRRPQRHHARQPLPPPRGARKASRSASTWSCAAPRSGWRRS